MNTAPFLARCGLLAAALLCNQPASAACTQQPVKAARIEVVGRDMLIDGVPASVYRMEFAGSAADVSDEFRAFWTRERVPAQGRREPSGMLLSALDGPCHYVLQITAQAHGARTQGLLSVLNLNGGDTARRIPNASIALPQGGRTVADVESRDPGQAGRTWIVDLGGEAATNAGRYVAQLHAQGWATVAQASAYLLDGVGPTSGDALALQRGSDRLDAIFSDRNGRTQAVIHATRFR